jgi:hypothetical protein
MKLIAYNPDAWQLENLCRRLTKVKNTVLMKTTSAAQLCHLLALCKPQRVFLERAGTPLAADGMPQMEAIVFHPDAQARKILGDQLLQLHFPIAASIGAMAQLRHWIGANDPSMVFFEPEAGQLTAEPGQAAPAKQAHRHSFLRHLMRQHGFVATPYPQWLETVAAAEAQLEDNGQWGKGLEKSQEYFKARCPQLPEGLDTLPGCWLSQMPGLFARIIACDDSKMISIAPDEIYQEQGMLHVGFAMEKELPFWGGDINFWDDLRVFLNSKLCPNRWSLFLKKAA